MKNGLSLRGDGSANPAFGAQTKNLILFQASGWAGLPAGEMDSAWPLHFGKAGYMVKSHDVLMQQTYEIRELGLNNAMAVLLMPDEESDGSGFGACWNSAWSPSSSPRPCVSQDAWRRPMAVFPEVMWAAWMNGLQVTPMFSINNYGALDSQSDIGALVLPKLKKMLDWYRSQIVGSAVALRTEDGRLVILTEGLPECTRLSELQRAELLAFMNAQSDVLWIDNLANSDANPSAASANILRTAAASMAAQDWVHSLWGDRYRFAYGPRWAKSKADAVLPENNMPQAEREKALGINPPNSNLYPVIVHQWNEYAEFLVIEPNDWNGNNEYDYTKWMFSRQP